MAKFLWSVWTSVTNSHKADTDTQQLITRVEITVLLVITCVLIKQASCTHSKGFGKVKCTICSPCWSVINMIHPCEGGGVRQEEGLETAREEGGRKKVSRSNRGKKAKWYNLYFLPQVNGEGGDLAGQLVQSWLSGFLWLVLCLYTAMNGPFFPSDRQSQQTHSHTGLTD